MENDYQLVTIPSARRGLKKLSLPVCKHIVDAIQILASNPYHGEQLRGEWRFLRSFHTIYRRTHYRVIYEVDEKGKQIIIRLAASRENFYKKLRRVKLRPFAD